MENRGPRPNGRVRTGLDVLAREGARRLRGKRVGLLAHAASVTSQVRYAWDVLGGLKQVDLRALFSPEHGLMGTHQDQVGVTSGQAEMFRCVPVYSLYGDAPDSLRPTAEMLGDIDLLLVDLQDVGSRYYTYIYTLTHCMEACRDAGIQVCVLDRPNPLGGRLVEGNLLEDGFESFVGRYPIPVRHGMTIAEFARMVNERFDIGCALEIIPMEGWQRSMWFDDTGLPWIMPSPNMPTLETATVYPGGCLFEGTNLSEGRGTTRPFEIVGAPWIEPESLARRLNGLGLEGVTFRPLWFLPTFNKHAGSVCGGIQIHVLDRERFRPYLTGAHIIQSAANLRPDSFGWNRAPYEFETSRLAIDLLAGGTWLREAVENGTPLPQTEAIWAAQNEVFKSYNKTFYIYP